MKNETNTQHTPAPWKLVNNTVVDANFNIIVGNNLSQVSADEKQGNLELIARAPQLLEENEQLKELNRIQYEVTADQNLKIQDLQALNAELLEALKGSKR